MSKKSEKIESTIYPNGFNFIHQYSSHKLPICSIHLYCDVGSSFETDELRGIAHFLEHMLFQGTKTKNAEAIFQEYDRIGTQCNAFTTKRYTCFYIKCHIKHASRVLNLFSDIMRNSTISKEKMKKEEKTIIQETENRLNDFSGIAENLFDQMIYKNSSFEKPVDDIRFHSTLGTISQHTLNKWYKWFYQPSNMVLSIVSIESFQYWTSLLFQTSFTKYNETQTTIEKPKSALSFPTKQEIPYNKTFSIIFKKNTKSSNTHLIIGFRTVHQYSDKKYIFHLLSFILNGMSGRLFKLLRQKHNLVYNVVSQTEEEEFNGYFSVSTECTNKNIYIVIQLLLYLFKQLVNNGITNEEFQIGKSRIHGNHHILYEDINTFAKHNGYEQLIFVRNTENSKHYHKITITPFQKLYIKHYDKIILSHLNNTIKEYFRKENIVVSIVSPNNISLNKVKNLCEKYS